MYTYTYIYTNGYIPNHSINIQINPIGPVHLKKKSHHKKRMVSTNHNTNLLHQIGVPKLPKTIPGWWCIALPL